MAGVGETLEPSLDVLVTGNPARDRPEPTWAFIPQLLSISALAMETATANRVFAMNIPKPLKPNTYRFESCNHK